MQSINALAQHAHQPQYTIFFFLEEKSEIEIQRTRIGLYL